MGERARGNEHSEGGTNSIPRGVRFAYSTIPLTEGPRRRAVTQVTRRPTGGSVIRKLARRRPL